MARNSNANCSTSRSWRKWPTSTASFAVRAMACKRPRCCETTDARTGPSRSSSSAAAATKTHPPGSEGSVAQRRQFSKSARTRGRPRACLNAGRMTLSTKRSEATRSISSCSSSFESKWAKRPLLERPSLPARAARLSPSRPSRAASRKAVSRMRSRVSVPFATGLQYDRSCGNASQRSLEPSADRRLGRGVRQDPYPFAQPRESFVLGEPLHVPLVNLLDDHRDLEEPEAGVEQDPRRLASLCARELLHQLRPRQTAGKEGRPEGEGLECVRVTLLYPVTEGSAQVHQRVAHRGHLPVQDADHPREVRRVEHQVVVLEIIVDERRSALRRHPLDEPARDGLHVGNVLRPRVLPAFRPSLHLPSHISFGFALESGRAEVHGMQRPKRARERHPDRASLLRRQGDPPRLGATQDDAVQALHQIERWPEHGHVVAERDHPGPQRKYRLQLEKDPRLAAHVMRAAHLAPERGPAQDELAAARAHQVGEIRMPLGKLLLRKPVRGKSLRAQEVGQPDQIQLLAGSDDPGRVLDHLISTPNPRSTLRATTALCTSSGPS